MTREGGCLCGAVRYRARGEPTRTVVCHCTFCQRATGSAFALWPTYSRKSLEVSGSLSGYEHRSDESGRWIRLHFCPQCGATVTSTFEKEQGEISVLGGTFDDTGWIRVDKHVWTRSAQHWVVIPDDALRFPKSSAST